MGAVVMKPDSELEWVNDSKKVTEKRREILFPIFGVKSARLPPASSNIQTQ